MKFYDFIAGEGWKCIITDRVRNANKQIRLYNQTGKYACLVKVTTLKDVAKELVNAYAGMCEDGKIYEFLTGEQCAMILTSILHEDKEKYLFLDKQSKSFSTSMEMNRFLSMIRMNHATNEFQASTDAKIVQIRELIREYEDYLQKNNLLDDALLYQKAIAVWDERNAEELIRLLPWLKGIRVGVPEDYQRTILEEGFLRKITSAAGIQVQELELVEGRKEYGKKFFEAYGMANEVHYVTKQIMENQMAFGDVMIVYASPKYENLLRAELEDKGIRYGFSKGMDASSLDYIEMLVSLLDFAEGDFTYEDLLEVIQNPSMNLPKAGKQFRDVLRKGIGWSKERYLSYFEDVHAEPDNDFAAEEKTEFAQYILFLENLINVFDDDCDCLGLYCRLMEFAKHYCKKRYNGLYFDYAALDDLKDVLRFAPTGLAMAEKIGICKEQLLRLRYKSGPSTDAVDILPYGGRDIFDRKHLFVLGLSAENVSSPLRESSIFTDAELKTYIEGFYPLAMERNKDKRRRFEQSLNTFQGNDAYFGYSSYDVDTLLEGTASLLYKELSQNAAEGIETSAETYPVEDSNVTFDKETFVKLWKEKMEKISKQEKAKKESSEEGKLSLGSKSGETADSDEEVAGSDEDEMQENPDLEETKAGDDEDQGDEQEEVQQGNTEQDAQTDQQNADPLKGYWRMSSSSLQDLLKCPLQFYYHVIEKAPKLEFISKDAAVWLDAAQRGNLVHFTLEKYINDNFSQTALNENALKMVYDGFIQEAEKWAPCPSKQVHDEIMQECYDACKGYLANMYNDLQKNGLKVIGCEIPFDEYVYPSKSFKIYFNGSVDRMDGKIDDNGVLQLRIVDYKTGKMENKLKEIKNECQIQHHIYALAMLEYVKQHHDELVRLFGGKEFKDAKIWSVEYHFPLDFDANGNANVLSAMEFLKEEKTDANGNIVKVERLLLPPTVERKVENTLGIFQKGNKAGMIMEAERLALAGADCTYCSYCGICRAKI